MTEENNGDISPAGSSLCEREGVQLPWSHRFREPTNFDDEAMHQRLARLTLNNISASSECEIGPEVTDCTIAQLQSKLNDFARPYQVLQSAGWPQTATSSAPGTIGAAPRPPLHIGNIWGNPNSVFLHDAPNTCRSPSLQLPSEPWNPAAVRSPLDDHSANAREWLNGSWPAIERGRETRSHSARQMAIEAIQSGAEASNHHRNTVERFPTLQIRSEPRTVDETVVNQHGNSRLAQVGPILVGPYSRPGSLLSLEMPDYRSNAQNANRPYLPRPMTRLSPTAPEFTLQSFGPGPWNPQLASPASTDTVRHCRRAYFCSR